MTSIVLNYGCFILNADHVYKTIDALPINAHPMMQFSTGVMALQVNILSALQNPLIISVWAGGGGVGGWVYD